MNINEQLAEELKRELQTLKAGNKKSKIESIDASLNPELLRLAQQARDEGASSWLNVIPLKDQGLTLNKQEFRGFLAIAVPLQEVTSTCACAEPFNVSHKSEKCLLILLLFVQCSSHCFRNCYCTSLPFNQLMHELLVSKRIGHVTKHTFS